VVVSIKHVLVRLRVSNGGEGGVLALSALLGNATRNWRLWEPGAAAGMLGAALFFGDGLLTPAISVLSAVEGVAVAQSNLQPFVVPLTVGILVALFAAQSKGTGAVGRVFGPIIIVWFLALGVLGAVHIFAAPSVLLALNPLHALEFFAANGWQGFVTLSAVFLAVTGGEALYADLGHFGRAPISRAWFRPVRPAVGGSSGDSEPVLPAGTVMAARTVDRAGNGSNDHCLAGGNLRRVFRCEPGVESRLPAAAAYRALIRRRDRADLRALCELG